jgi:hypothetical protein
MIEKRDLHIGRWYNFKNPMSGELVLVQFSNWSEGIDFEAYGEPIELSPEWMEKMGFKKRKDKVSIWELKRLTVWLGVGCLCYLREEDSQFSHYVPNGGIKYVHQLMNFVYAFTGEELTIKSNDNEIIK